MVSSLLFRSAATAMLATVLALAAAAQDADAPRFPQTLEPLQRSVDLNVGEAATVTLCDGATATVKLLDLREHFDPIQGALRRAEADVEVNGVRTTLVAASYRLPDDVAGVRIDCPITRGYVETSRGNSWALDKAVRLRLWPEGSPLIRPETFTYPVKQKWFASETQMCNVPTFVDGGESPARRGRVYYHSGLDFGGAEGLVEVVAAVEGTVVIRGTEALAGYTQEPWTTRYDVVIVMDARGWCYRYSHLVEIDEAIQPGVRVAQGQRIGVLGKEGASGGWAHTHFEIKEPLPDGRWATVQAYGFAWEAYLREQVPAVIAVARPHIVTTTGSVVTLDGSRSWARIGEIARYDWRFHDGATAHGALTQRIYTTPGQYSEVLRIEDGDGNVGYDFQTVEVQDPESEQLPPTLHAAFAPTQNIQPDQEITFKVRAFRTTDGEEHWDFGDGSPSGTTKSDGCVVPLAKDGYAITTHRYESPGDYIVRVERRNARDEIAMAHLHVRVREAQ